MVSYMIAKSGLVVAFLTFFFSVSYSQNDTLYIKEVQLHRQQKNTEMRAPKGSPLDKKQRRKFKGLSYFPVDPKYRVNAKFIKSDNPVFFKMLTTTDRLPDYSKFGEVHFTIDSVNYKLEVYQNPDIIKRPGYEDYLFIPFTDLTNGEETYEVGRYLDLRIPKSDSVVVDFNKAYNPYCSYSSRFSCPIPPEANKLYIAIPAGEKKYHH